LIAAESFARLEREILAAGIQTLELQNAKPESGWLRERKRI